MAIKIWDNKEQKYLKDWYIPDDDEGDWPSGITLRIANGDSVIGYADEDGGKSGLWEHEVKLEEGRYEIRVALDE